MPGLFVIGDSISIGYGPSLAAFLPSGWHYDRKRDDETGIPAPFNGANGEDSRKVAGYLRTRLAGKGFAPETLLLINCGLHDLRRDPASAAYQVPLARYEYNLRSILGLAREHRLRLIWARTTPVEDALHNAREAGFQRFDADVMHYNAAADALMAEAGVPRLDLYGFTRALLESDGPEAVYRDHVHFAPEIERLQGAFVAGFVVGGG